MDKKIKPDFGTTLRISTKTHQLVEVNAKRWGVDLGDYAEFCIKLCNDLEIDPTNYTVKTARVLKKNISTVAALKTVEDSVVSRISETRSTYISFIKQMEKEHLKPIMEVVEPLRYILEEVKKMQKSNAFDQFKHSVLMADTLTQLLVEDKSDQIALMKTFVKKIKS